MQNQPSLSAENQNPKHLLALLKWNRKAIEDWLAKIGEEMDAVNTRDHAQEWFDKLQVEEMIAAKNADEDTTEEATKIAS